MTNYEEMSLGRVCNVPLKEFIYLLEYKSFYLKALNTLLEGSTSTLYIIEWSEIDNLDRQIAKLKEKLRNIEEKNL